MMKKIKPKLVDADEDKAKITKCGRCFLMDFPEDEFRPSILHLQGNPHEMGYAHGYLLADKMVDIFSGYFTPIFAMLGGWDMESGTVPKKGKIKLGEKYFYNFINRNHLPAIEEHAPELLEELNGLYDGVITKKPDIPLTWKQLLIIQCAPEALYMAERVMTEFKGCSSFAAWDSATTNGKLIHGANLDEISFDFLHKSFIVRVVKPDKGNSFMGLGWTGCISPTTWMNDKALSWSEMTSHSINVRWPQIPHVMQGRLICQYASNLKEAYELSEKTGGTTGFANLICDGKNPNPRATCIEITGAEITQRFDDPEFPNVIWVTNYFNCYPQWQGYEGIDITKGQIALYEKTGIQIGTNKGMQITREDVNTLEKWRDKIKCPRYEKYRELIKENYGKIDVQKAAEFQSAYEMTYLSGLGRTQLTPPFEQLYGFVRPIYYGDDAQSTYSTVFVPIDGDAWVAGGKIPAQEGPWWKINLYEHLDLMNKL